MYIPLIVYTHGTVLRRGTGWNCSNLLCKHMVCVCVCVCVCVRERDPRRKTRPLTHHSSSRPPFIFFSLLSTPSASSCLSLPLTCLHTSSSCPPVIWCPLAPSISVSSPPSFCFPCSLLFYPLRIQVTQDLAHVNLCVWCLCRYIPRC